MTAAVKIIHKALSSIGAHTVTAPADPSLIEDSLDYLKSILDELERLEIILEDTAEDGTVTKVAIPDSLDDELQEPAAAFTHLVSILAVDISPIARVPHNDTMAMVRNRALGRLSNMFRQHTPDKIKPDSILPKGAGNRSSYHSRFFSGDEELS